MLEHLRPFWKLLPQTKSKNSLEGHCVVQHSYFWSLELPESPKLLITRGCSHTFGKFIVSIFVYIKTISILLFAQLMVIETVAKVCECPVWSERYGPICLGWMGEGSCIGVVWIQGSPELCHKQVLYSSLCVIQGKNINQRARDKDFLGWETRMTRIN